MKDGQHLGLSEKPSFAGVDYVKNDFSDSNRPPAAIFKWPTPHRSSDPAAERPDRVTERDAGMAIQYIVKIVEVHAYNSGTISLLD